jgi:hypothetical protein
MMHLLQPSKHSNINLVPICSIKKNINTGFCHFVGYDGVPVDGMQGLEIGSHPGSTYGQVILALPFCNLMY